MFQQVCFAKAQSHLRRLPGRQTGALDLNANELGVLGLIVLVEPVGVREPRRVLIDVRDDVVEQLGHGVRLAVPTVVQGGRQPEVGAEVDDVPDAFEQLHLRLAGALETRGEPVLSASHWREARQPERAARHYASAGELALDALAFGDAASHYRAALSLGTWSDGERKRLLSALGDALSNAGMGAEAAHQYRIAAEIATPSEALQLKRSAAEELVRSGYLDEGLSVAREVLSAVAGLAAPLRDALVAVHVAGLNCKEAAARLGVREGTIMSRCFRARAKLAPLLEVA